MNILNSKDFLAMVESGSNNLENYEKEINTLNVFPVPDGDTGTNMSMTFTNGYKEASNCLSNNVCDIAKSLSKGLLMGARGNSGVITSQIFRGFAKAVDGKENLNVSDISNGFIEGARVAYKAIMKPVEGTILTVIKESAYYASKDLENNSEITIEEYFDSLCAHAKTSLDHTPDLLQALKDAGVVDSGGAGLFRIFEGFNLFFKGEAITKKDINQIELSEDASDYLGYKMTINLVLNPEYKKGFDTSIINKRLITVSDIVKADINADGIDYVVNTVKPGEVLNVLQRYGEFGSLNVENHLFTKKPQKNYGIIAVSQGEGLNKLFLELGTDIIISGGQTMNPSTQDFLDKIDELDNCKTIFVLPNNSNIILAAEQAKTLAKKDVIVIPSKSLQAGISALALFDANDTKDNNEKTLTSAALSLKTAQITYAVKDTSFDGIEVKKDDYISIVGKTIIDSSSDLKDLCFKTIESLKSDDSELLTIISGEGSNSDLDNQLVEYSEKLGLEVELIKGDQPVYAYLFGLE